VLLPLFQRSFELVLLYFHTTSDQIVVRLDLTVLRTKRWQPLQFWRAQGPTGIWKS